METAAAVSDLERRKKVRVRLRPDLAINSQKYEGRTYFVVKDPVSLRYYRFKEHEKFLLDLMDGKHTLDDAQKEFEQRFRPERLTLEDLEAFASQLLGAGLAQNESPAAGKQLFDRYKKRQRKKFWSSFLNILYIKIPIYDPDRVLTRMLPPLRFIFTLWFLFLSIVVMLAALGLVASHWNTFMEKLPTREQFFTFNTLIYMWVALGAVKVIHEFGHGLSCKAFGGEVHEMGALFLVFSPCLYCNVSDAWTLPSKWKRIVISAAGIYVELLIASLATFVWWWTESGGFLNSLAMSLMVVCSVSTVIFNANPLMRFDGYYVLADWLEIPNLRDRSNKFLQSLAMQHCLGIEVPPERYMTRSRQVLFVVYAITSYIYRWVITFGILYFMYTFLKPYKLGTISFLLGTGAVASMVGYPIYRLIKGVRRRGRLPDMKPVRVWICVSIIVLLVLGFFLVPFRYRVKGLALVQVEPAESKKVVITDEGCYLTELRVQDGDKVQAGDQLAILENPELESALRFNQKRQSLHQARKAALRAQFATTGVPDPRGDYRLIEYELDNLRKQEKELKDRKERLVLRAPRDGVVMKLLRKEELNKLQEKGVILCEVGDERALRAVTLVEPSEVTLVKNGSAAWVRIHGLDYNYWPAQVSEISAVEAKEVPPQLSNKAGGDVPTQQDPQSKVEKPQTQHYLIAVSINLDEMRDARMRRAIQPGVMGRVKIEAEPQTLYRRLHRYLATTFGWGL